jgi:hypothetical protein
MNPQVQRVQSQLNNMHDHRPYFTYVTALIQVCLFVFNSHCCPIEKNADSFDPFDNAQVIVLACSMIPGLGGERARFGLSSHLKSSTVTVFGGQQAIQQVFCLRFARHITATNAWNTLHNTAANRNTTSLHRYAALSTSAYSNSLERIFFFNFLIFCSLFIVSIYFRCRFQTTCGLDQTLEPLSTVSNAQNYICHSRLHFSC